MFDTKLAETRTDFVAAYELLYESTRVYDQYCGTPIPASQFATPPMSAVDRAYFTSQTATAELDPCLTYGAA